MELKIYSPHVQDEQNLRHVHTRKKQRPKK